MCEATSNGQQGWREVTAADLRIGQTWRGFAGDVWNIDWVCAASKRAAWTVRFTPVADRDDEFHAGRAADLLWHLNANRAVLIGGVA